MDENEIKSIVIEGYRNILKRDPDPSGLANYVQEIKNGLSIERFYEVLITSDEFRQKFGIENFNRLVHNNKASGRPWYHGLEGTWWWGKTEEYIREIYKGMTDMTYSHPNAAFAVPHIQPKMISQQNIVAQSSQQDDEIQEQTDKIVLISTWGIKCGIATYTGYLLDEFNKIVPDSFIVNPINEKVLKHDIIGKLAHLQHEFGIMPKPPKTDNKVIVTWHSVLKNINDVIKQYESDLDIVAHIVHSEDASDYINSSKDVHVVGHGSMLIPEIKKDDVRKILNIDIDIPIGFVFGFQSGDKNYVRLLDAAKNTNMHLIISGAVHEKGCMSNIPDYRNVTFLNRYLTETEVSLYALASDILLFDYVGQDHCSVSGAMHRVVGAGRPVICSNIRHFSDIDIAKKFKDQKELEEAIKDVLEDQESLGKLSLKYAKDTSWENIAKKHIEIYREYVDI